MKKQKENLKNKISVLESSTLVNLIHTLSYLDKLTEKSFMSSGLVIEIKDLSGNQKAKFMVSDGFKIETINELKKEIEKSINLQTMYLPKKAGK